MSGMLKYYIWIILMIFGYGGLAGQGAWELAKKTDGITIHTRAISGSGFKEFKAEAVIDNNLEAIVAAMQDPVVSKAMNSSTMEIKVLEESETRRVHYVASDAPWPVSDRDGVFLFEYSFLPSSGAVRVDLGCLPDYLPEKTDRVRIKKSKGYWLFTPLENGQVKVFYQLHVEPGGNIPAWLANSSVVDTPLSNISALRRHSKKDKYKNRHFDFIKS